MFKKYKQKNNLIEKFNSPSDPILNNHQKITFSKNRGKNTAVASNTLMMKKCTQKIDKWGWGPFGYPFKHLIISKVVSVSCCGKKKTICLVHFLIIST